MRWHTDKSGAEWTATVTADGVVRVLRRTVKPPYREGGDSTEAYETFEFDRQEAAALATTLNLADDDASNLEPDE